jgi:uncharacterized SAM-binding protein YcdF (DUF218 family)
MAAVAAGAVIIAVIIVAVGLLFVWPRSSHAVTSDAVVVLAGGQGERLQRAQSLMRDRVAPVLVISNGNAPGWDAANQLCSQPQDFEVICPNPGTTRSEARMVGDLGKERSWRRVVVITSTYHVRRASLLIRRCLPSATSARVVGVHPHSAFRPWTAAAHEAAGLSVALLVQRSC